ncbi:MAG: DUF4142 domain-containing protein, partial [Chthoniobacterales bacterium]|nr:DUF4142 domain-containing protein [Chthoniobacterales bacterium]
MKANSRGRACRKWFFFAAAAIVSGMDLAVAAEPPSDKGDQIVTGGDLAFLNDAGPGGAAEVELGRMAGERAASAEVKKFAQQMIEDHAKAGEKLKKLPEQKKVALPAEILPQAKQTK